MKKTLLLAFAVLAFASCQQKDAKKTDAELSMSSAAGSTEGMKPSDMAAISFDNLNYNFGTITQGERVSYSYKFKNTGKSPLIITNAEASCGCTVPEVPKEPIKPGDEAEIKVVFNSEGKMGLVDKQITVSSNGVPNMIALHLTGEIKER